MKTTFPLSVLALSIAAFPLAAQTAKPATPPAAQKTATSTPATAAAKKPASTQACSKELPALSPKIPALPAGLPCAKPLYTVTLLPNAKLSDVSPMEDPKLSEALGLPELTTITLSYIDTKVGSGALTVLRHWYTIKYTGYLVDGTQFDSSDKHPDQGGTFTFQQGPQGPQNQRQVVVGMDTGLDGMRVGGKRRLFIPYQLGYGPTAHLTIPPKSWLIFDIELVSQSDKDPRPKPPAPPAATAPKPPTPPVPTTAPAPAATPAAAPKPPTPPAPATTPTPATAPKP